ncbi:hypothetical protein EV121DRAFT_253281 [Schizophyllum commune]
MGLLCWCTLSPQGPSNLAAIRFSAPVRVASIQVFPKGARPFAEYEDFTSETAPECFYAELLFNATPIHVSERDKNRFPNSLVPTTLAYAGNHVDYTVDMGTEHATRLMIVKGNFKRLSLAVYGDLVSDLAAPKPEPAPISLTSIEPRSLSAALDLVNAQDASSVATKLMSLLKNPPPLPVILRSQFCLKPDDDTWDHPDYPNVYVDLAEQLEDFKFRAVIYWTRPISETASEEDISAYFSRFARAIDEHNDNAEVVSRMLRYVAAHPAVVPERLFAALDASKILAVEPLEDLSLEDVLYASANVVIARHLCTPEFLASLRAISSKASSTCHRRTTASRIVARLEGWRTFEDALKDADGSDYFAATRFLADIGTEEISLGIWLLCMVQYPDMSDRLAQRPLPATATPPPLCLRRRRRELSSDDFTAFLKAFLGTAAVVGVACWADCFANDICFERALAVLHLWQQAPGYSEIVNLILALDQTCRRIKWSMEDRTAPRRTELLAEQILTDLAFEPKAVLRDELITTILATQPPLSYITEDTRIAMQKLARIVDDGLQEGVENLARDSEHPYTFRRLSVVRVALAMIEQALEDPVRGEWDVIQALHTEKKQGLLLLLGDLLKGVVQDLNAHFSVREPPPVGGAAVLNQLFLTAEDLVAVISPLAGAYPLSSRPMYELATSMAHVVVCAGLVGSAYPTFNTGRDNIRVSAHDAELGCLELLAQLCAEDARTDTGKPGAEVVLRALFEGSLRSDGKDPALHLAGVFRVVEHLLPRAEDMTDSNGPSYWVAEILPHVLRELSAFFRALDVERKIQLLERLVKLDDGLIGVGEWLLTEEVKHMGKLLEDLPHDASSADFKTSWRLHDLTLSARLLARLLSKDAPLATWTIDSLRSTEGLSTDLTACLTTMLERQYASVELTALAEALAKTDGGVLEDGLRFILSLWLLRSVQSDLSSTRLDSALAIIRALPTTVTKPSLLRVELGKTLSAISQRTALPSEMSSSLISILGWLASQPNKSLRVLSAISLDNLSHLYDLLADSLPADQARLLEKVRTKITVDEDETLLPPTVTLPETWTITLEELENARRPQTAPSTPKRNGNTPDILGPIISPPTAILRSPAATGLTKTYSKNDFRHLRQLSASMQNTSRMPSTHVDVRDL